jgi:hypothetical protein
MGLMKSFFLIPIEGKSSSGTSVALRLGAQPTDSLSSFQSTETSHRQAQAS